MALFELCPKKKKKKHKKKKDAEDFKTCYSQVKIRRRRQIKNVLFWIEQRGLGPPIQAVKSLKNRQSRSAINQGLYFQTSSRESGQEIFVKNEILIDSILSQSTTQLSRLKKGSTK